AAFMFWKGLNAAESVFVNNDNLTRLDVADKLGMDQVQGTGFTGQHPAFIQLADAEGPEPVRIAHADQFLLSHDDERKGAFNTPNCLEQIILVFAERRLSHQMEDDFAIDRRL